ncbi:MAG: hypothetical protein J5822_03030 [Eubacteriaceae bacterium]|nr:hypothetical protein [Eubacteriaceae bacterium]
MEAIIGILWGVAVISSVFKAISSARKGRSSSSSRTGQSYTAPNSTQVYRQQVPYTAVKETASSIRENGLLLEDRKNDWLAKQMREEAEIYRRGSLYDLGAAHEADCDARRIKLFHIRTHNTNGMDKKTFE